MGSCSSEVKLVKLGHLEVVNLVEQLYNKIDLEPLLFCRVACWDLVGQRIGGVPLRPLPLFLFSIVACWDW